MRYARLVPFAVLALAVACSENSPNPMESNRPLFNAGGGGSPHYQSSLYSVPSSSPFSLSHAWVEVGLGSFTTVPYLLTADFDATVHCENGGGNTVNGKPYHLTASASADLDQAPRNGGIRATLTLGVTPAATCQGPGNNPHTPVIDNVVWSNIEFCWGNADPAGTLATRQGPVPGGTLTAGESRAGSPLTGTGSVAQGGTGIFAACA
jgi:hypothetical protein